MRAFHNDPEIKAKYIARLKAHALADEIVKGQYWEDGKGCAVGCTIHSSKHAAYEDELGIPEVLAHLEDRIFEQLPNVEAKTWPLRFLEAVPVGADLALIWPKLAVWLLVDPVHGVAMFNASAAITDVAKLYQRVIDGHPPTTEQWRSARVATDAARTAVARTVTYAAHATAHATADAADAAYAYAYAYAYAAAARTATYADHPYDTAYAAAHATAWAAAAAAAAASYAANSYTTYMSTLSEKLLSLLSEA